MLRLVRTAGLSFVAAWLILTYVGQIFRIQGESMAPALHSEERVLVDKIGVRWGGLERGDIVVFTDPRHPGIIMVKRVVAVPGDTVRFEGDVVLVSEGDSDADASFLDGLESEARAASATDDSPDESAPEEPLRESVWIGPDHYFVLGDNRAHSRDSRHWGLLPESQVIGRVAARVHPLDRFGRIAP